MKIKSKLRNWGFLFHTYCKFISILQDNVFKHKPLISEECSMCDFIVEKAAATFAY